jgi:predicted P-loop ATPase
MANDKDGKVIKGKFPRGADSAQGWHNESFAGLGQRTAVYPYADKDGNLIARVNRWEWEDDEGKPDKRFPTQSLIEPLAPPWNAHDDKLPWIKVKPPVNMRPLYRFKELIDAPYDATVFIPEGEKDADTCVRLGFVATTIMGGADSRWRTIDGLYLEGRDVVILIDNDDKGRIRGEFLRRKLERMAADIRVVLPPGVGPKGDITNWATQNPKATHKDIMKMVKDNTLPPLKAPEDDELLGGVNKLMAAVLREEGWKDIIERRKVARTPLNAANLLTQLEISVRFDEFNNKTLIGNTGKSVHDASLTEEAATWIVKQGSLLWKVNFAEAMLLREIAERACTAHFNPVRDWFDSLKWDGVPRLNKWLHTYVGAADTKLNEAYGRKWLMAAVRRATTPKVVTTITPGVKFDYMLVFEGMQGIGKSSALKVLAGEQWFTDRLSFHIIDKQREIMETITGKIIVEMSEFAGYRNKEMEVVKSFLSRTHDTARLAYRRDPQELARTVVFAGTTNSNIYLLDQENRRFWCVKCGVIDIDGLAQDREQLWAEAAVAAATNESLELDKELWEASNEEAEKRKVDYPLFDIWLAGLKGLTEGKEPNLNHPDGNGEKVYGAHWPDIYHALNLDPKVNVTGSSLVGKQVKLIMERLGWSGPRKFHGTKYFWRADKDDPYEF